MTQTSYTCSHWAKSDREEQERIHLLEHHLADVGACFEAILAQPTIRRRLAHSGGRECLDDATIARLSLFAALHDIGKLNMGFQTQIWRNSELPQGKRRPDRAGHTLDLTPILSGADTKTGSWFFDALGWNDFLTWDDKGGETACGLLIATFSHHGRPLQLEGGGSRNPQIWSDFGDLSPRACAERIGQLLRDWFPQAFDETAPLLPSSPGFQHMFLGLCTLADWIGSNERWFEYIDTLQDDYINAARGNAKRAIRDIGLNIYTQRNHFNVSPEPQELFGFKPNAIQRAASQDALLDEPTVVIESETGSGKTEAALWRFAKMYERDLVDGIYFALPTRAAAAQIHERVKRFAASLFAGQGVPPVVLAVPGYDADTNADSLRIDYDEHSAGNHRQETPWASENPKRYLAAQVAVGTVDQAMMGALKVRHAHMRAACLARNLLVVDEVHASDAYMRRILEALLEAHIGAGGYALLMSATLGSEARRRLLSVGNPTAAFPVLPLDAAIDTAYPAVSIGGTQDEIVERTGENGRDKRVQVSANPIMSDFDSVARLALNAAQKGAKVLVVRNTVRHAVETQQTLERIANDDEMLFKLNGIPTLHHGRFAAHDRRLLDSAVEAHLGKQARRDGVGFVVIGTQTLEQSLDIDADLLITDLCPMDVLLQRIGRLHRHERDDRAAGYCKPRCIVLTPPDNDLSPLLERGQNANGLGPHGGVYDDLRILEATLRLIVQQDEWNIPAMNRELVERATHPAALEMITSELGEDWQVHAVDLTGKLQADEQFAQGAIIRRDKCFYGEDGEDNHEVVFDSDEADIRTRLGDERVEIAFATPQDSPFSQVGVIDKVAMPVRWLPEGLNIPENEKVKANAVDSGFEFIIGDRGFRYDRLGLHRV